MPLMGVTNNQRKSRQKYPEQRGWRNEAVELHLCVGKVTKNQLLGNKENQEQRERRGHKQGFHFFRRDFAVDNIVYHYVVKPFSWLRFGVAVAVIVFLIWGVTFVSPTARTWAAGIRSAWAERFEPPLEYQIKELEGEIDTLREGIPAAAREVASAEVQVEKADRAVEQADRLYTRTHERYAALATWLENPCGDNTFRFTSLAGSREVCREEAARELSHANTQLDSLARQLQARQNAAHELRGQLATLRLDYTTSIGDLDVLEAELATIKIKAATQSGGNRMNRSSIDDIRGRIADLRSEQEITARAVAIANEASLVAEAPLNVEDVVAHFRSHSNDTPTPAPAY